MTAKYLAIDPGETNGYATFDEHGDVIKMGQFRMEDITEILTYLITSDLDMVICEDYKNFGHKGFGQKKWGRNETSKIIGKIELMCDMRNVKYVLQSNTVKPIGYKWAGLEAAPTNHSISHQYDAIAHGVYWLQKNGIRPVGRSMMEDKDGL